MTRTVRKDVPNGTNLGIEEDWGNDPCKKIVNQLYSVSVLDLIPDDIFTPLKSFLEKYEVLGFESDWKIKANVEKDFTSPLECMEFIESLDPTIKISLRQRKRAVMGGEYWEDLSKDDLEKILVGEKIPYYSLVNQSNLNFSPCVDIGD